MKCSYCKNRPFSYKYKCGIIPESELFRFIRQINSNKPGSNVNCSKNPNNCEIFEPYCSLDFNVNRWDYEKRINPQPIIESGFNYFGFEDN